MLELSNAFWLFQKAIFSCRRASAGLPRPPRIPKTVRQRKEFLLRGTRQSRHRKGPRTQAPRRQSLPPTAQLFGRQGAHEPQSRRQGIQLLRRQQLLGLLEVGRGSDPVRQVEEGVVRCRQLQLLLVAVAHRRRQRHQHRSQVVHRPGRTWRHQRGDL